MTGTAPDLAALRETALAALAVGDGQDLDGYDLGHTAEIMYGKQADAVLAALAPHVTAQVEQRDAGSGYAPFDQDRWLGKPPWKQADPKVIAWEAAHGHDVRLKCYPEFGCFAIESDLEARLAAALARVDTARRDALAPVLALHYRESVTFEEPWPNGFVERDYCGSKTCRTKTGARLQWPCPTVQAIAPQTAETRPRAAVESPDRQDAGDDTERPEGQR